MQTKSHIEALRERRSIISDNTTTVANMINQQMHQLFHDPKCFIYEIIQNAEDAEADSIAFKIEHDNLIISYNGKPFQEHDIERVCDASRDNDPDMRAKSNQSDKIGYKGIGFKSVFGISNEITILSPKTNYFFRFSKKYWDDKVTEHSQNKATLLIRFPWQIIPLWLEPQEYTETAESIGNFEENVTIILKNVDCHKIVEELKTFVTLDERLIFLNRIKKIEFFYAGNHYSIQKNYDESLCKISRSERNSRIEQNKNTLWHIHNAIVQVDADITEKLVNLDISSCPEKIKSAKNTEIMFAVKLELLESGEYDFFPPRDSKLYCYLPTSIDCHLPFLVNARFILNQDRSTIINNPWNSFLLKSIAIQHLTWLANLANISTYRINILKLLSSKKPSKIFPQLQRKLFQENASDENTQISLLDAYEAGVAEAKIKVAFIPAKDGHLLCFKECIIDTTNFFIDIDEKILDKKLLKNEKSRLVSYDLQNRETLIDSSVEYDFQDLLSNIEKYFHRLNEDVSHLEIRSKMMMFILNSDQKIAFFEKKIFLCTNDKFYSPNDSFVLTESHFTLESLAIFQINIVKLSLYDQQCVKKLNKTLEAVSEEILIKKQIKKLIQHDGINESNSIPILRFVYTAYAADANILAILAESHQERGSMSRFKVITRDGQLRVLSQCFLPLTREDKKDHQNLQLSAAYFKKEDDDSIWKKLLTCAKIITTTEITVKDITYGKLEQYFQDTHQQGNLILEYTKHILDQVPNSVIPAVVRKEFKERLIFSNFIDFPFLFDLNDVNTLSLFLNKLNTKHDIFSQTPKTTGMRHGNQVDKIDICEHFITYYFRNNILINIKGSNQRRLAGGLFYLPELLENFDPDKLPVKLAELPIHLSPAAANFLGFKLSINLKNGLELISSTNEQISKKRKLDSHDFDCLKIIYKLLIKIDLTREDVSIISPWKEKHKLLSQARTFESAGRLKIFDQSLEEELICPDTPHWLHDVGLNNNELKTFARVLNITCYSEDEAFTPNVSIVPSEVILAENLKKFVLSLLPALTLIEDKEYGIAINPFHIKIFDEINTLNFEYCSDITFDNGYKPVHFARISGNCLYFTGRRMHIKVSEILSAKLQSKRAQEWLREMIRLFLSEQENVALIKRKIQEISSLNQAVYDQLSLYQVSKIPQATNEGEQKISSAIISQTYQTIPFSGKLSGSLFNTTSTAVTESIKKVNPSNNTSLFNMRGRLFDPAESPVTNPCHLYQERKLCPLGNKPLLDQEMDNGNMTEKDIINKNIGDRGEEIVFRKIVYLLEKQWKTTCQNIIIHDQELDQSITVCRFIHANRTQLDVIWYNKDRDNTKVLESPVDIVIAVNGEKKYFIEVKSTISSSSTRFFLTTNEWEYMQEKRANSILVRAYNVASSTARFEVYKDPFGMIFKDLIAFMTGGEFRLKIKSAYEAREHIFEEDPALGCKIS